MSVAQENYNGKGRQKCTYCSFKSIAGLVRGEGLCRYHWALAIWGRDWANKCYPDFKEIEEQNRCNS